MDQRVTVGTGGSRGIGAAICLRLAAEGHDVAVGCRSDAEAAEGVDERVRALGRAAVAVAVDTADAADADPEGMRQALEVDVLGYLLCARRAIGDMTAGGAIVNVSSAAATLGSPGTYVHHAVAKAAVDAMTVGLSKEVAAGGIRVNRVARARSGPISTPPRSGPPRSRHSSPWAAPGRPRRSPERPPGYSRTTPPTRPAR